MGEVNQLSEAVKFMFIGMGVVFLFLTVMIYALKLQAFLISKFVKEEEKKVPTNEWKPVTTDDKQITAAITAAIIHHNKINKG